MEKQISYQGREDSILGDEEKKTIKNLLEKNFKENLISLIKKNYIKNLSEEKREAFLKNLIEEMAKNGHLKPIEQVNSIQDTISHIIDLYQDRPNKIYDFLFIIFQYIFKECEGNSYKKKDYLEKYFDLVFETSIDKKLVIHMIHFFLLNMLNTQKFNHSAFTREWEFLTNFFHKNNEQPRDLLIEDSLYTMMHYLLFFNDFNFSEKECDVILGNMEKILISIGKKEGEIFKNINNTISSIFNYRIEQGFFTKETAYKKFSNVHEGHLKKTASLLIEYMSHSEEYVSWIAGYAGIAHYVAFNYPNAVKEILFSSAFIKEIENNVKKNNKKEFFFKNFPSALYSIFFDKKYTLSVLKGSETPYLSILSHFLESLYNHITDEKLKIRAFSKSLYASPITYLRGFKVEDDDDDDDEDDDEEMKEIKKILLYQFYKKTKDKNFIEKVMKENISEIKNLPKKKRQEQENEALLSMLEPWRREEANQEATQKLFEDLSLDFQTWTEIMKSARNMEAKEECAQMMLDTLLKDKGFLFLHRTSWCRLADFFSKYGIDIKNLFNPYQENEESLILLLKLWQYLNLNSLESILAESQKIFTLHPQSTSSALLLRGMLECFASCEPSEEILSQEEFYPFFNVIKKIYEKTDDDLEFFWKNLKSVFFDEPTKNPDFRTAFGQGKQAVEEAEKFFSNFFPHEELERGKMMQKQEKDFFNRVEAKHKNLGAAPSQSKPQINPQVIDERLYPGHKNVLKHYPPLQKKSRQLLPQEKSILVSKNQILNGYHWEQLYRIIQHWGPRLHRTNMVLGITEEGAEIRAKKIHLPKRKSDILQNILQETQKISPSKPFVFFDKEMFPEEYLWPKGMGKCEMIKEVDTYRMIFLKNQ